VRWSNGVPAIDPGFSSYYKVGPAGGIDVSFCSVSCYPIPNSTIEQMTNAQSRAELRKWGIPGSRSETNVVQWNVNLGLGFTSSRWIPMPAYHRLEPVFPQRLKAIHQLSLPLVQFDELEGDQNAGWSGIDLRCVLEPLRLSPVRTLPNEKDMTNYVAGTGLAWSMEEALNRVTAWSKSP
jgi:hypothetical protein